jgi:hypothetical protein
MVRSTRWPSSQRAPSAMSARMVDGGLGPFGSQPAWQSGQQRRRDREAGRVQRERRRRGGCEQDPAEGRPDQGGPGDLDGLEAGVGAGQAVAVDHHRQSSLGGVVEHGVGGGGREEDHQQDRDRRLAGEHGEGQQPQAGGAGQVGGDHQPAAVGPVGHGPAWQREQQPRQGQGHPDRADPARVLGERCGQQRRRRDGHPVPEVGRSRGHQQGPQRPRSQHGPVHHAPPKGARSASDSARHASRTWRNRLTSDSTRWSSGRSSGGRRPCWRCPAASRCVATRVGLGLSSKAAPAEGRP